MARSRAHLLLEPRLRLGDEARRPGGMARSAAELPDIPVERPEVAHRLVGVGAHAEVAAFLRGGSHRREAHDGGGAHCLPPPRLHEYQLVLHPVDPRRKREGKSDDVVHEGVAVGRGCLRVEERHGGDRRRRVLGKSPRRGLQRRHRLSRRCVDGVSRQHVGRAVHPRLHRVVGEPEVLDQLAPAHHLPLRAVGLVRVAHLLGPPRCST